MQADVPRMPLVKGGSDDTTWRVVGGEEVARMGINRSCTPNTPPKGIWVWCCLKLRTYVWTGGGFESQRCPNLDASSVLYGHRRLVSLNMFHSCLQNKEPKALLNSRIPIGNLSQSTVPVVRHTCALPYRTLTVPCTVPYRTAVWYGKDFCDLQKLGRYCTAYVPTRKMI